MGEGEGRTGVEFRRHDVGGEGKMEDRVVDRFER